MVVKGWWANWEEIPPPSFAAGVVDEEGDTADLFPAECLAECPAESVDVADVVGSGGDCASWHHCAACCTAEVGVRPFSSDAAAAVAWGLVHQDVVDAVAP